MLVSEIEIAESLSVTTGTLRQWRYTKIGPPFYKLPTGAIRYDLEETIQWAKNEKKDS